MRKNLNFLFLLDLTFQKHGKQTNKIMFFNFKFFFANAPFQIARYFSKTNMNYCNQSIRVSNLFNNNVSLKFKPINMKFSIVSFILFTTLNIFQSNSTKIDRYDLAIELYEHGMTNISTWICIIDQVSELHYDNKPSGLFGFSPDHWCMNDRRGHGCNMKCSQFENRNLSDDIYCAKILFNKNKNFAEWGIHASVCESRKKLN